MSEQQNKPHGLEAVLLLREFRLLWLGQIFSQLGDKFWIVLMVFLIAQTWAQSTGVDSGPLAGAAELIRERGLSSGSNLAPGQGADEAQLITLLATGIYAANTLPALVLAGLLVGIGTRYGAGCTSGHGICGLSRWSLRSLVAVGCFMGSGFAAVYFIRHLLGA